MKFMEVAFQEWMFQEGIFEPEQFGGHLINNPYEVKPALIAVITAVLLAGGYIGAGSVITAVRPVGGRFSPWKLAGIIDLMNGRLV